MLINTVYYYMYIDVLIFLGSGCVQAGDSRGHDTRNGRKFFELFEEGTWQRPGNNNYIYIYLPKLFYTLKINDYNYNNIFFSDN